MPRFILTPLLALVAAATITAQPLPRCADTGESRATRTIRPLAGALVTVASVPQRLRAAAIGRYLRGHYGAHAPDELYAHTKVTGARKYTFANKKTFYLLS